MPHVLKGACVLAACSTMCKVGQDLQKSGAAPCWGPDAKGACFLLMRSMLPYAIVNSRNAGGWPLLSFSQQGQSAQPWEDLRGLPDPDRKNFASGSPSHATTRRT